MSADVRRLSDGSPSYLVVDDNHNLQTSGGGGGGGSSPVVATGAISTLASSVSVATGSSSTIFFEVLGDGTGFALTPQISQDAGTTWINVSVEADVAGSVSTPVSSITTTGNWSMSAAACDHFRLLNATAITGGSTLTAKITASPAVKFIRSAAIGAQADTASTWYNVSGSMVALLKLMIATYVGAGSHVYGYTAGNLTTDAWTFLGTTRTKTYTYTAGVLTAESDWV